MNSLWPSRNAPAEPPANKVAAVDVADIGISQIPSADEASRVKMPSGPTRPGLQRNQPSVPPPPLVPQPPPPNPTAYNAAPGSGANNPQNAGPQPPQDSLSLAQLRRIVAEFPRTEPIAYDYVYADMAPVEEEIDEWFVYNFWQWVRLNTAQRNFYAEWASVFDDGGDGPAWDRTSEEQKRMFVKAVLRDVRSPDAARRSGTIGALTYLVLGRWMESVDAPVLPSLKDTKVKSAATPSQLAAMKAGVELLAECGGIPVVWEAFRKGFEPFW